MTKKYVEDKNGNKCYFNYFGGEEQAIKALATLASCSDCLNCSNCSNCSSCSSCSDCSYCSYCSYCSSCSRLLNSKNLIGEDENKITIPKIEEIDKKVYECASKENALNMSNWHTCETTHCRAGWVVHLAGDEGRRLEEFHNTELAAMLIYRESGSPINPSRFYDSNTEALVDMKKRAGL
jgi:hypothetical protein